VVETMLAPAGPGAFWFLPERFHADGALHFVVMASCWRAAVAILAGLAGPSQPGQLHRDCGRAGLDVREGLEARPHPDHLCAGVVLDREHEALQPLEVEPPPGPRGHHADPPPKRAGDRDRRECGPCLLVGDRV
jgi:hypothetical protein